MLPSSLQNIIIQLSRLPGLGERSATRLAFWLLNQPKEDLEKFAQALKDLKQKTKTCPRCFNLATDTFCSICSDQKRNKKIICIVEDIMDIIPIERTKQYSGVYHILGGLISPTEGLTPEKLKIKELVDRIKKLQKEPKLEEVEIILAFNPTSEGDATTLYLQRLLRPLKIKITRLGRGLSTGSDLEYTDETTLTNALLGRK